MNYFIKILDLSNLIKKKSVKPTFINGLFCLDLVSTVQIYREQQELLQTSHKYYY